MTESGNKQSDKQSKNNREEGRTQCSGENGKQGGKKKKMQIVFLGDDLSLGWRQANPIPEIITHSDEEVNEIDLNVLSGDVPAAGRWCILHAQESLMLSHIFYCYN